MKIEYANKQTERLCNDTNYASKKLQPKVVAALQLLLTRLNSYPKFRKVFFEYDPIRNKYRTEYLKNTGGVVSLRLDYSYRVTLTLLEGTE